VTVSFNFRNSQILISVTFNCSGKLDSKYIGVLSPIYHVVISQPVTNFLLMTLSFQLERSNFHYEYWVLDNESFRCGEVYCSLTIITLFIEILCPSFDLKLSSSFNFTMTTPNKISKFFLEN